MKEVLIGKCDVGIERRDMINKQKRKGGGSDYI
jgi:hypothetical protein